MYREQGIQQQVFTRDREGVFRTNEGFDTVAKSPGLEPAFIKNSLHPYCVYKAPQELLTRGEAEADRYPAAFGAFRAESGELVIGRTLYMPVDFTGQRSAFFTHQFIVPPARAEDWVREPARLFHIGGFRTSYDLQGGKELPELPDIDYNAEAVPEEADALLGRTGFGRESFRQLLHAVMSSPFTRRKVYIALDAEPAEAAEEAKRLMEFVYACLPFALRRVLGFLTYSQEPEGKQDIHVTFVERGSLKLPDRQLEKDMLFDMPGGTITGAELPPEDHPYFKHVWALRHEPQRLEPLFEFCDEALRGMDSAAALTVSSYGELCTLFEIEQGRDSLYAADRQGTMERILSYLQPPEEAAGKLRLHQLFQRLLRKETGDSGSAVTAEYISVVVKYSELAGDAVQPQLARSLSHLLERAAKQDADDPAGVLRRLVEPLYGRSALLAGVFEELYERSPVLGQRVVADRLAQTGSAGQFVEELGHLLNAAGGVPMRFFAEESLKKVRQLLRRDTRRRMETAQSLYTEVDALSRREGARSYASLCELILLDIQLSLLEDLEPDTLGYDDIVRLDFMLASPRPELLPHLDTGTKLTLGWLSAVFRVLTLERGGEGTAAAAMEGLGPWELERVQSVLRRALEDRITPEHFPRIPYAFYHPDSEAGGGSAGRARFQYGLMLDYVTSHSRGSGVAYDFIVWSAGDERFAPPKIGIDPHYRAALSRYFEAQGSDAFRQKDVKDELLRVPNEAFQRLFREVRRQQAPAWQRLLLAKRRTLLMTGVPVLLLLIIISAYGKSMMGALLQPAPELRVEAVPETSPTGVVTVKAQAADEYDPKPKIYVNDVLAGESSVIKEIPLNTGGNEIVIKAENKYGEFSEPFKQTVRFEPPAPLPAIPVEQPAGPSLPASAKDTPAGPTLPGASTGKSRTQSP
ncbi:GAP1-N2 domain-containing protein [Paenibacillus caseinilyticus]|uniref:GAP1-N2 domain-containing protein n=1 Tax=Paenibacillus caseinilyticus TaxID=3098138 RepID=UPI0022B92F61|nr:hypothetical protein [Paenibacillus caseinilyticus]MCZ8522581.1 hypothetical protein [Paenibacillus caseinilyticus]